MYTYIYTHTYIHIYINIYIYIYTPVYDNLPADRHHARSNRAAAAQMLHGCCLMSTSL